MLNDYYIGFAHIAIYTADMGKSILFYESIGATLDARSSYTNEEGTKELALISLANFCIELIQPPAEFSLPNTEGILPHFSIWVNNIDEIAKKLFTLNVPFKTPKKDILPNVFGGVQNWYIIGPSGEQIELLQKT